MNPDRPWFAPKAYGIGSSFPITWEGWVTVALFVIGLALDARYVSGTLRIGGAALVVGALVVVCALKTKGGWRFRQGGRE